MDPDILAAEPESIPTVSGTLYVAQNDALFVSGQIILGEAVGAPTAVDILASFLTVRGLVFGSTAGHGADVLLNQGCLKSLRPSVSGARLTRGSRSLNLHLSTLSDHYHMRIVVDRVMHPMLHRLLSNKRTLCEVDSDERVSEEDVIGQENITQHSGRIMS